MTQPGRITRPGWHEYFLGVAAAVARRGDCRRRQVGAVVVTGDRIVSTGYNGTAPGAVGCIDGGCPRGLLSVEDQPPGVGYGNCIANHAEANALIWCPVEYRQGSVVYITAEPCKDCQALMAATGVVNAYWRQTGGELGLWWN